MSTFDLVVLIATILNIVFSISHKNWYATFGWFVALLYFIELRILL